MMGEGFSGCFFKVMAYLYSDTRYLCAIDCHLLSTLPFSLLAVSSSIIFVLSVPVSRFSFTDTHTHKSCLIIVAFMFLCVMVSFVFVCPPAIASGDTPSGFCD